MGYLSILPTDLKNLLQHYTNYDNWFIILEIYKRFLQYFDTDHEDVKSGKQAVLDAMNLKFSLDVTELTHALEHKYNLLKPKLEVDQLVTFSSVKKLLNILTMCKVCSENHFIHDMFSQINSLLEDHKCPLQVIYLKIAFSFVKQDSVFVVIDTTIYNISDVLDNIKHQIEAK